MEPIDEKAHELNRLYVERDAISAAIIAVETELIALVGTKTEGRTKARGEIFTVMTTGKLNRKLDVSMWESIRDKVPEEMHPVRTKVELDLTKLRKIEELSPSIYKIISRAITEKPAKTSVIVKVEES